MAQIQLHNYFRSSTSYRVRIALHYKDIPFDYFPVHLLNNGGEHHRAEYKDLNPLEEVPSLVHDGKVIAQSFAIIEYLEEVFPKNSLLPPSAFERAKMRQFCENINSFIHPLSNLKVLQFLEKNHGYDLNQKEFWVQHWSKQGLASLEEMLRTSAGTYCFGDKVSMADLFLVPQVFSAKRFHMDLSPYPLVQKIDKNCEKLEAFRKAHPFRQIDTPPESRLA